jgi:sialate O-acetylesterase
MVLQQKSKACIWGKAGVNEQIFISTSWGAKKTFRADMHGLWSVKIPTPKGSYEKETISIEGENKIIFNDILIGEVWLCSGQSNMGMEVRKTDDAAKEIQQANYPNIRFFHINQVSAWDPQYNLNARWKTCNPETVAKESAVAYFFGRNLHTTLNVPVGLIVSAYGGTKVKSWLNRQSSCEISKEESEQFAASPSARSKKPEKHLPFVLFNGMINPVKSFTVRGAIWYQGESDVAAANTYRTLFPALISGWRTEWRQGNFPFYFVQIPPFQYKDPLGVPSAELRDAQLKTLGKVKNTGMVVISDISSSEILHPTNKKEVGRRLALLALHNDYKINASSFSSSFYKSHRIKENKVIIKFDFADQLKIKGSKVIGFTIAGNDEKFVSADAEIINNNQIMVWSDQISNPVSVRFGWTNSFKTNLFNEIDLPVSPFKTDDWKDTTAR